MTLQEQITEKIALLLLQLPPEEDMSICRWECVQQAQLLASDAKDALGSKEPVDLGPIPSDEYKKVLAHLIAKAKSQGFIAGKCKKCGSKTRYDGGTTACPVCWRRKMMVCRPARLCL